MDELQSVKEKRKKEHRFGDVRKACEKANVRPATFQSAIKKNRVDDLTDKERSVLLSYLNVMEERKKENENLKIILRPEE